MHATVRTWQENKVEAGASHFLKCLFYLFCSPHFRSSLLFPSLHTNCNSTKYKVLLSTHSWFIASHKSTLNITFAPILQVSLPPQHSSSLSTQSRALPSKCTRKSSLQSLRLSLRSPLPRIQLPLQPPVQLSMLSLAPRRHQMLDSVVAKASKASNAQQVCAAHMRATVAQRKSIAQSLATVKRSMAGVIA